VPVLEWPYCISLWWWEPSPYFTACQP